MGNNPMDDEFEMEVTDLNTSVTQRHHLGDTLHTTEGGLSAPAEAAHGDEGYEGTEHEPPTMPQRARHQRARTAIVSGTVLLALMLVVALNPVAHSAFWTAFGLPTTTPITPPPRDEVFLLRGAPWATVTLDSKKPPRTSVGIGPDVALTVILLARGSHTLVVTQAPFPSLHCIISQPASPRDTCPLVSPMDTRTPYAGSVQYAQNIRGVDLGARFDRLPSGVQRALVAMTAAQFTRLGQPTTLQPGDHYVRDDGSIAVAQATLHGVFAASLIPPSPSEFSDNSECRSFCDLTGSGLGNNGISWEFEVHARGGWRITDASGAIITKDAPMVPENPADVLPLQLPMSVSWSAGSWQFTLGASGSLGAIDAACQMGKAAASVQISAIANGAYFSSIDSIGNHSAPEQGCTVRITDISALLYYHFGVLVAVDDAAHMKFPDLPMASAHERALAQQILDSQPG